MGIVVAKRGVMSVDSTDEVRRTARNILAKHPHFRGRADNFEFVVDDCILHVRGRVPSFYLKQILQTVLQGVTGIRRVDNQVDVVSVESLSSLSDDDR